MRLLLTILSIGWLLGVGHGHRAMAAADHAGQELSRLLNQVEALDLSRGNYTLGARLTPLQRERARSKNVSGAAAGTYKFKDGDLFVVAHETTHRVILIYQHHEPAAPQIVRKLVGTLFYEFGDPTILAHDKLLYWVFGTTGKVSEQDWNTAKKKRQPVKTLATIKLSSSHEIVGQAVTAADSIYYVISSEPVLKRIQSTSP